MSDNVKVSRVEIQIGSKTHMLTIEQAKKLRDQLCQLFGVTVEEHHHRDRVSLWWPRLSTASRTDDPMPNLPEVWCHSSKASAGQLNSAPEYTARLKC